MLPHVNKELVKRRFKKSMITYDRHAIIQEQMADRLIELVLHKCGNNFNSIFEIGCGTGILTKKIVDNLQYTEFYGNDIVQDSEEYIKKYLQNNIFIEGDIETLDLSLKADLIISNATFQWLLNPIEFYKRTLSILKDNGILAFTTFGAQNLHEISKITNIQLDYNDYEEIIDKLSTHFECVYYNSNTIKFEFDNPIDVLKHLKYTGVNALSNQTWSKKDLINFQSGYNQLFCTQNKVSLTYHPVYIILKKL